MLNNNFDSQSDIPQLYGVLLEGTYGGSSGGY